ncbi:hypothetical protein [Nocardioides conyzicola]|uniref:Uncharacterized protein n=1 Tax=Nocardioides conyzicola TaxID=1651781 RepID=A0ABP8XSH9_9ACTN
MCPDLTLVPLLSATIQTQDRLIFGGIALTVAVLTAAFFFTKDGWRSAPPSREASVVFMAVIFSLVILALAVPYFLNTQATVALLGAVIGSTLTTLSKTEPRASLDKTDQVADDSEVNPPTSGGSSNSAP